MPSILIIEKNASIKPLMVKSFNELDLYKKAGFKTNEGFARHTTWNVSIDSRKYSVELYGKQAGRAGQENKYDFPPPVDKILFFGACVLVSRNPNDLNQVMDLTAPDWKTIYEHLFGGFEDIGDEDSEEEDEDDGSSLDVPLTKNGYVKDGFVVEDDDDDSDTALETSSEEEYKAVSSNPRKKTQSSKEKLIPSILSKKTPKLSVSKKTNARAFEPEENIKIVVEESHSAEEPVLKEDIVNESYLGCTDELQEEPYV